MNLQVFQYQNSPITFSKDGEVMVNATQMAKPFPNKKAAQFILNANTKEFVDLLDSKIGKPTLVVNHGGSNPGTWMHQKLALKFAGWLSPEFELWVYDRIEELLTTGKTELTSMSDDELLSKALLLSHEKLKQAQHRTLLLEAQNEQHIKVIQEQAPMVAYYNQVLDTHDAVPTTIIAQDFGLSANRLNKRLEELKVIRKVHGIWVMTSKYNDKGFTRIKNVPYIDREGNQKSNPQMVWTQKGREFLHTLLSVKATA
ncbi:phage antirepressor KilAC domain-containing protein [Pontibacter sp. BT731]|uniref:phage antirepressor KilAC domain-containing protein n=1 Tax=Pontibacter coccineus TaxID=3063328 RepID=UPI0026E3A94C|nr:phage antirepressor KilAC domain-containing protein [Pontibacter sp. BT731]MDO6389057.1 phage antirepressor KilAC domain-containing protein [Pontibacter sp. BT731]